MERFAWEQEGEEGMARSFLLNGFGVMIELVCETSFGAKGPDDA